MYFAYKFKVWNNKVPLGAQSVSFCFKNYLSLIAEHHGPDGWQSCVGVQYSKAHWILILLLCSKITCFYFICLLPWSLREVRHLTFIINVTCTVEKNPNSLLMTTETRGKQEDGTFCSGLPERERSPQLKSTLQILSFLFTALARYTTASCCTCSAEEMEGLWLAD